MAKQGWMSKVFGFCLVEELAQEGSVTYRTFPSVFNKTNFVGTLLTCTGSIVIE